MLQELDGVKLKRDIPAHSPTTWPDVPSVDLSAGDRGTIVTVYTNDSTHYEHEVESVDSDGMTRGLLTLQEDDIEPL